MKPDESSRQKHPTLCRPASLSLQPSETFRSEPPPPSSSSRHNSITSAGWARRASRRLRSRWKARSEAAVASLLTTPQRSVASIIQCDDATGDAGLSEPCESGRAPVLLALVSAIWGFICASDDKARRYRRPQRRVCVRPSHPPL